MRYLIKSVIFKSPLPGPPVSRQMMNLTVESGINVYLRCPASGYPIISTTWQYNGKQLSSEFRYRVFDNGTLLIQNVISHKDQGEYSCIIRNRNDQSAIGRLFLTVMGKCFYILSSITQLYYWTMFKKLK